MWFSFIFLVVLMTALFATAIIAIVRNQLKWEDEKALTVPEEQRRIARSNYRIIIGTMVAVYVIFLGTAVYLFIMLRNLNVF